MEDEKKLILVVDDNLDLLSAIEEVLDTNGYIVKTAGNGREAWVWLLNRVTNKKRLPDLILLDVLMPVMSGLELFSKLSSLGNFSNIPVVVLSAKRNLEGMSWYVDVSGLLKTTENLSKPFDLEALLTVVKRNVL